MGLIAQRRLPIQRPGQSQRTLAHLNQRGRKDVLFRRSAIDVVGWSGPRLTSEAALRCALVAISVTMGTAQAFAQCTEHQKLTASDAAAGDEFG